MAKKIIEGTSFDGPRQYGSGRTFSGLDLRRVKFTSGVLAQHDDPSYGLVVRDSTLRNCSFSACGMAGVKLENVTVHGARFNKSSIGPCLFRHVTLRGRIGQFNLVGPHHSLPPEMFTAFWDAMVEFYRDVDWALDIRDAAFTSAGIRTVPGELVRRDESRHFLLHRKHHDTVRSHPDAPVLAKSYYATFDLTPFDSTVAIAAQASKIFEKQLAAFRWLRDQGFAE